MAYHTASMMNQFWQGRDVDRPSSMLRFLRRRRVGAFGGSALETIGITFNPFLGGPIGGAMYSLGWGAISAPFEAGRAAVKTARFLEKVGQSGPEYATPVVDTRLAYTMRQAALQAMHDSAYSLRGAIGRESTLLHS